MNLSPSAARPLRAFCSYAHEDEAFRKELATHLKALEREGLIAGWSDRDITPGQNWEAEIDANLEAADIVLLLVSSDFIASDYCVGKEMTRALERRTLGEARVIPVILRKCAWMKQPIGALQALPGRGKPIKNWKDRDRALNQVVEGVRRAAEQLRGDIATGDPRGAAVARQARVRRRRIIQGAFAAAAAALLGTGLFTWHAAYRRHVDTGNSYLNIRRLDEARAAFNHAQGINPFGAAAGLGLEKIETWLSPDRVVFRKKLDLLKATQPGDPHVQMMLGNLAFVEGRIGQALADYDRAIALDPGLAEAHFGRGAILQGRGDFAGAIEAFRNAVEVAASTSRYRNNLAYLLARTGRRLEAIGEYLKIESYPLGQIEVAQLYWRENAFGDARDHQYRGIAWLKDPAIAEAPENRGRWSIETPTGGIELGSTAMKLCYARLTLAGSLHLLGRRDAATEEATEALQTCRPEETHLKRAVMADLDRLVADVPSLQGPIKDYKDLLDSVQ